MLSSSKPDKSEAKLIQRLDVLAERVDTLAQTVATTASAMAKKDGEIAALRRELDARDERLADFITKAREATGGSELRELKEAVAALAKDRGKGGGGGGGTKHLDDLAGKVALIGQRLDTLSTTVSTTAAGLAGREGELATIRKQLESGGGSSLAAVPDPALIQRVGDLAADVSGTKEEVGGLSAELTALRNVVEQRGTESGRTSDEVREMLVVLRTKVEELAGFKAGVTEEQLEPRFAQADASISSLSDRVDTLAGTIDSAVTSLGDKEHELAALNRHFTEASARIESIVGDIRDALAAFPELGSATNVDDLAARLDRVVERVESYEATARELAETRDRSVADLAGRIEGIEQQVATVASEVARAKTLWPVALRSLEARLDDVTTHGRRTDLAPAPTATAVAAVADTDEAPGADDDLLAGLRDSLQAMENVAAEMARASDALGSGDDADEPEVPEAAVAAGGATIVPLRSSDG